MTHFHSHQKGAPTDLRGSVIYVDVPIDCLHHLAGISSPLSMTALLGANALEVIDNVPVPSVQTAVPTLKCCLNCRRLSSG
jgi:hypothetical protein